MLGQRQAAHAVRTDDRGSAPRAATAVLRPRRSRSTARAARSARRDRRAHVPRLHGCPASVEARGAGLRSMIRNRVRGPSISQSASSLVMRVSAPWSQAGLRAALSVRQCMSSRSKMCTDGTASAAHAEQDLERLHGLHGAEHCRNRAKHARLRTIADEAVARRLGPQAAQAGPLRPRQVDLQLSLVLVNAREHGGFAEADGGIVDPELGGEVVGAVDHEVVLRRSSRAASPLRRARHRRRTARRDSVRAARPQPRGLGPADVVGAIEWLPVQVAGFDACRRRRCRCGRRPRPRGTAAPARRGRRRPTTSTEPPRSFS